MQHALLQRQLTSTPTSYRGISICSQPRSCACAAAGNGVERQQHNKQHRYDLLGLSNLCVDVVVNVDSLPGGEDERVQLLHKLTAAPPSEEHWEVGGNCNVLIAAARLGMNVGSIGHVGSDVYGGYMDRIMRQENINSVLRIMPPEALGTSLDETLLCFVLVDPQGRHSFVSAYDFGPWPLLEGVTALPTAVTMALQSTAAVFTNGFVFDELPLDLVKSAVHTASEAGAAICFDPGPRAFTMKTGSRRHALDTLLDSSHVVLMTEEEAVEVTGKTDPQAAAETILSRPSTSTEWCIVKMGGKGAVLVTKAGEVHHAPAFQVEVKDTVGCGDSFAAAIAMGFCRTHDVRATLLLANAVGAATATGRGAGTNVARADTVMQLLQRAASDTSSSSSSSYGVSAPAHQADIETAIDVLRTSLSTVDDFAAGVPSTSGNGSTNGTGAAATNGRSTSSTRAPARAA